MVNDVQFGDLPEYRGVREAPDIAHSSTEEFYGQYVHRRCFNVFLNGRQTPVSIEHNMRDGTVDLDVAGKPIKSWYVKSLA